MHKAYERAQTRYQRLLKLGVLKEGNEAELRATYQGLDPVRLLKEINDNLEQLLADLTHSLATRNVRQ